MLTCKSTRCRGRKDKAQLNLNFDERFRSALHFINRRPWEILAALQIRKERSRGESINSDWALKIRTSKSNTLAESDASRMTKSSKAIKLLSKITPTKVILCSLFILPTENSLPGTKNSKSHLPKHSRTQKQEG